MLSAVIQLERSCSACLVRQPIDQRLRNIAPFVLDVPSSQIPTPLTDIEQTVSQRFEPSSRSALMGELPHPWSLLHDQVAKSRHRCGKPRRRYELSGVTTQLSPE